MSVSKRPENACRLVNKWSDTALVVYLFTVKRQTDHCVYACAVDYFYSLYMALNTHKHFILRDFSILLVRIFCNVNASLAFVVMFSIINFWPIQRSVFVPITQQSLNGIHSVFWVRIDEYHSWSPVGPWNWKFQSAHRNPKANGQYPPYSIWNFFSNIIKFLTKTFMSRILPHLDFNTVHRSFCLAVVTVADQKCVSTSKSANLVLLTWICVLFRSRRYDDKKRKKKTKWFQSLSIFEISGEISLWRISMFWMA